MSLNAKQRSFLELLKGTATGFGKVFFVGLALSACVSGR